MKEEKFKLDEARERTTFVADDVTGEVLQVKAVLNDKGQEVLDPIPMAPPVGYDKPFDMFAHVRNMVRSEHLRIAALEAGQETFEESDDFEVGEDYDPNSPYEEVFDPVQEEVRMRLREADYRAKVSAQYDRLLPQDLKDDKDAVDKRDKGRVADTGEQSGKRGKKRESDPGKVEKSDDVGSDE